MKIAIISLGLWAAVILVIVAWNFIATLGKTNTEDDDE